MGAPWVLGCHRPGGTDGTRRHAGAPSTGTKYAPLDCRAPVGPDSTKRSGLLIRGFGVRVPGGAPVIKALTWCLSLDRSHFHVHSGRLCAPCVLRSQSTVVAPGGLDGPAGTRTSLPHGPGRRCRRARSGPGRWRYRRRRPRSTRSRRPFVEMIFIVPKGISGSPLGLGAAGGARCRSACGKRRAGPGVGR